MLGSKTTSIYLVLFIGFLFSAILLNIAFAPTPPLATDKLAATPLHSGSSAHHS